MKHLIWITPFLLACACYRPESAPVTNTPVSGSGNQAVKRATEQPKHESAPASSDMDMVKGDWVLAFMKSSPSQTGSLSLNVDHTFTGKFLSKEMGQSGQKLYKPYSGTFALSHSLVSNQDMLFVDFKITMLDGKMAPAGSGMRLAYDKKNDMLNDLLTLAYCRPGKESKVKAMIEGKKKS